MAAINLEFAVVMADNGAWIISDDEGNTTETVYADKTIADAALILLKAGHEVPKLVQSAATKAAESLKDETPKGKRNLRFVPTETSVIRYGEAGYSRAARVRQVADSVFDNGLQDDIQRIVYETLSHEGDTVNKSLCYKYVSDYLKRRAKA